SERGRAEPSRTLRGFGAIRRRKLPRLEFLYSVKLFIAQKSAENAPRCAHEGGAKIGAARRAETSRLSVFRAFLRYRMPRQPAKTAQAYLERVIAAPPANI